MSDDVPAGPGGALAGFQPGSRIAGYVVEEQVGAGGMAAVFRARDVRLDRQVALKILSPALAADEAFRLRFTRESRAAAAVDDPHIIPVFEAGEADGVLFIAMRYVRGGDVRSLLAQSGPLPPARAAEIISQVASALDAAHERGLVHRDVKPGNMLLDARASAGRPDHVYLSDFGLSKAALATSGLTGSGQFLGTVDYISPEQIEGKPVDGRADQYALACAAFELLTGAPPFRRDEVMAVVYAQVSQPPPAATSRRPELPAAVDEVLARALAKAPADRWAGCQEFADALRAALGVAAHDSGERTLPGAAPTGSGARRAGPPTQVVNPRQDGSDPGRAGGDAGTQRGREPGPLAASGGPETRQIPARPTAPEAALTQAHAALSAQAPPAAVAAGGRPAWRPPALLAGALAALLAVGGAGVWVGLGKPAAKTAAAAALRVPGCGKPAAAGKTLSPATTAVRLRYPDPFGVAVTRNGKYVFASDPAQLSVLTLRPDRTPAQQDGYYVASSGEAAKGIALSSDGRYVAVAVGNQVNVQSAGQAEQGASTANAANLVVPGVPPVTNANAVAYSRDDQFIFVTMRNSSELAVFNVKEALTSGQTQPGVFVGTVALGIAPTGLAVSPDGRWLYVVSAAAGNAAAGPGEGAVSVLSVRKLETDPKAALVAQATAGCSPGGVAVSPDGKTVWVSAQRSNALLGFSAATLRTDPAHALAAVVRVGQTPGGVTTADGGAMVIVADTNRNGVPGADNLAVVDASAALARKPALIGYVPSGRSPLNLTLSSGGRYLYVCDSRAAQIQVVDLSTLRAPARG